MGCVHTVQTMHIKAKFNDVIKLKPSDESVLAVAENNTVGIKQTHDLFDRYF